MKTLFCVSAENLHLADPNSLIFKMEESYLDARGCPCPAPAGEMPLAAENEELWENERLRRVERVCGGLVSFSSTKQIHEIDDVFGTYGFKNLRGEVVIEPQYASAAEFSMGLCAVCLGRTWFQKGSSRYYETHWGYIDEHGKTVLPFHFREAWPFNRYGVAVVSREYTENYYLIDLAGRRLEAPQDACFDHYEMDYDSRFVGFSFGEDEKNKDEPPMGIYDTKERRVVLMPQFEAFYEIDEETILVQEAEKEGVRREYFINAGGEPKHPHLLAQDLSSEWPGKNGCFIVRKNHGGACGLSAPNGEVIIPVVYDKIRPMNYANLFACYRGGVIEVIDCE